MGTEAVEGRRRGGRRVSGRGREDRGRQWERERGGRRGRGGKEGWSIVLRITCVAVEWRGRLE